MKGINRRFIAVMLSLLMVLSQMSLTAFAVDEVAAPGNDKAVNEQAAEETPQAGDVTPAADPETSGDTDTVDKTTGPETPGEDGTAQTAEGGTAQPADNGTPQSAEGGTALRSMGVTEQNHAITVNNKTGNPILLVFTENKGGEVVSEQTYTVQGTSQRIGLISLDEVHTTGTAVIDNVSGTVTANYSASERSGYDNCITLSGNIEAGGSIDIVPAWTVTFDPNGADRGEMQPQLVKKGDTVNLDRNTYEKDDYTFAGWSKDEGATEAKYSDGGLFKPTGDTTLFAVWSKSEHQHHWSTIVKDNVVAIKCTAPGCPIDPVCKFRINTPSKVYDGVPYQDIDVEMISGQIPEGFTIPDDSEASTNGIRYYDKNNVKLDGAPTDAGENYYIKASIMYEESKVGEVISYFSITPAPLTVEAESKTKTYGDPDPELTVKVTGLAKKDKAKDVLTGKLSRDSDENVGEYAIKRGSLAVSNSNYELKEFKAGKLTITKAKAVVTKEPQAAPGLVEGSGSEMVTEGETGDECKMMYALGEKGEFTNSIPKADKAGEYVIRYKAVAKESYAKNYEDSEEGSVDVTVTPLGIIAPEKIDNLVYNGGAQQLVTPGSTNRGEMYYYDNGWTKTIPSATEAGNYTVDWAVFIDGKTDKDHMLSSGKVAASIAKLQLTEDDVTAPEAVEGLVYNDELQQLVTEGRSDLATFKYRVGTEGEFTPGAPYGEAAGTYDVYYEVVPKSNNYKGFVSSEPVPASIAAKNVKAVWGSTELTYNGKAQAPKVSVVTDDAAPTPLPKTAYTVTGQKKNATATLIDVLTYRAEVTVNDTNYNLVSGSYTFFIINQKEVDLEWQAPYDFTYDGTAKQPFATVSSDGIEEGDSCDVDLDGYTIYKDSKKVSAATDAGEYTVSVGTKGLTNKNYKPAEATASKAFTISKAELETAVVMEDWTYGDEPNAPYVTNNPEKSEVTYAYYRQISPTEYKPVTGTPKEAGIYVVEATVAESANYNGKTVSNWFRIESAETVVSVSIEDWTFGEEPKDPKVECSVEGAVPKLYYGGTANDGTEYGAWDTPPEKAGNYSVLATLEGTGDYSEASDIASFTIERANPELTISSKGWTYGDTVDPDEAFEISAKYKNFNTSDLTYFYYKDGETEPTIIDRKDFGQLDAGKVTVGVSHKKTTNYTEAEALCEVNIAKADLPFSIKKATGLTYHYDETRHEADAYYLARPDVDTLPEGVTVKYKTSILGRESTDWPVGSDAGTYTVWYSIDGGNNYKSVNTGFNVLPDLFPVIEKAVIEGTQVDITGWTYGGYDPTVNGPFMKPDNIPSDYDPENITFVYAPQGSMSYTEERPEDAGSYAIKALLGETDNYKASESLPGAFTIGKAPMDLSVTAEGWTYGEEPKTPVVEGNVSGKEATFWYWSTEEGGYRGETAPTDAGSYNVQALVEESANYQAAQSGGALFTIEKADPFRGMNVEGWKYSEFNAKKNMPVFTDLPEEINKNGIRYKWMSLEGVTDDELDPKDFTGEWLTSDALKTAFTGLGIGEYAVIARIPESSNYIKVVTGAVPFEVTEGKADYDENMLPSGATGLKYTGEDQVLFADMTPEQYNYWLGEGSDNDNDLYWAVTKQGLLRPLPSSFTKMTANDMPKGNDVDTYYVWLRVVNPNRSPSSVTEPLRVQIGKADITLTLKMKNYEYGTAAGEPVLTGNTGEGKVTYKYEGTTNGGETYSDAAAPTEAGSYKVTATVASTGKYNGGTASDNFKVSRAPMDLSVTAEGWTYGDEPKTPAVEGNVSGKEAAFWYWSTEEGKYPGSATAPTDAGSYYVQAIVEESANYQAAQSGGVLFTIEKADPFKGMSVEDWKYSEFKAKKNMPVFTDLPEEIKKDDIRYNWMALEDADDELGPEDFGDEWITYDALKVAFEGLEIGSYAVIASIPGSDNYKATVTDVVQFEVTEGKADYNKNMLPAGATGLTYDGKDHVLFADMTPEQYNYWLGEGSDNDNDLYWAVTKQGLLRPLPSSFTKMTAVDMPKGNDVDTYYVWLRVVNPNRASASVTEPLKVRIGKADLELSLSMADYVYGTAASKPVLDGNTGEGKVTYKYEGTTNGGEAYSDTAAPTEAGSYKVTATVASTGNYNGGTASDNFTVSRATMTLSVAAEGWTYGDEPKTPSVGGNVSGKDATFWYWKDGEEGSDKAPTAVGSYNVKALVAESSNYEAAESGAATFTIEKADPFNGMIVRDWAYGKFLEARNMPEFIDLPKEINANDIQYKWISIDGISVEELNEKYFKDKEWIGYDTLKSDFEKLTVGEYAVIAKITSSDNYKEKVTDATAFEVTSGEPDYDKDMLPTAAKGLQYNGEDQLLFTELTDEQRAYWFGEGSQNELYWAVTTQGLVRPLPISFKKLTANSMPERENVDTYYVWLKVVNSNRRTTNVTRPLKVQIGKADLALILSMNNYEYGETASRPVLSGNTGEGDVTFKYEGVTRSGKSYSDEEAPTKAGSYTVTATVASTGKYNAGTATAAFEVLRAPLTITANSKEKVYDGKALTDKGYSVDEDQLKKNDHIIDITVTGSQTDVGRSDNIASDVSIRHNYIYPISDVTDNYNVIYVPGELKVTQAPLTITAESATKVYDGKPLTADGWNSSELVKGDAVKEVTVAGSQTAVGTSPNEITGVVIMRGKTNVTNNYDVDCVDGTLEVTKRAVKITALSSSKEYDGTALDNNGYTYEQLGDGDWIDTVDVNGSQTEVGRSANVPSNAVIKNSSGAATGNYDFTYVSGTLEVTPRALTIIADAKSKTYGQADPALTYTSEGLLDGDSISGALQRDAGENTGSYAIRQGSLTAGDNYAIAYKGASLKITADKTALNDSIAKAQSYYDSIKGDYPDIAEALRKAIQQAQSVADQADPSQTAVNNARISIENAVATASSNVAAAIAAMKASGAEWAAYAAAYAPGAVKLIKATKGSKSLTATFKRVNKNVAGYQVMVTNTATGEFKVVKVKQSKKSVKKISKTVKKLGKKTTYRVQVRAYNVVYNQTYFGPWSNIKTVTTR